MRATIREAVKSEPTWTAVISKAEFGRRIGLSKGRIYQLVAEGLPFSADRRIDFAKAMRWVDRNLDQHRRVARKPGAFPVAVKPSETEPQSVSGKCSFGNRNSKKASGELVDRAVVERAIVDRATIGDHYNRRLWVKLVVQEIRKPGRASQRGRSPS